MVSLNSDGASFAKDSDFLVRGLKRPLLSIWHLPRPIWPSMMHNDHALRCAPPNGHPTDHFQRIFGQVLLTIQRFGWPGRRQGAPSTSQPGPNPPGGVAMGEGRGSFAPATRWCPPAVPPTPQARVPVWCRGARTRVIRPRQASTNQLPLTSRREPYSGTPNSPPVS